MAELVKPRPLIRRSPWPAIELVGVVVVLVLLFLLRTEFRGLSIVAACQLTSLVALATSVIVIRRHHRGLWSPVGMFMVVFVLFHCGLAFPWAIGSTPGQVVRDPLSEWFFDDTAVVALWLTCVACCTYVLGARLGTLGRAPRPALDAADASSTAREIDRVYAQVGAGFMFVSVAAFFYFSVSVGGFGLLIGTYGDWLDATFTTPIYLFLHVMDFGAVLLAASRWSKWHRAAAASYVVWTAVALPLGMRGEVLFPLVTALSVASYRAIPMRPSRAVLFAVALLTAAALVRNVRNVGISGASLSDLSASPLDGLAEMGTSLRPVAEVVKWDEAGDDHNYGDTYWAPFDRSLVYVIPGWTRPPVEQDDRVLSNLAMERAGPIGFSVVAEAYRNFSTVGVVLVMAFLGFVLARLSSWSPSSVNAAYAGILLGAIMFHIRNTFIPVPSKIVIGCAFVAAVTLIARARADRHLRPRRSPRPPR